MHRVVLSLLAFLVVLLAHSFERWDVRAKNGFRKSNQLVVSLNLEGATICDLDSAEFADTANKHYDERKDGVWRLKRFYNRFMRDLLSPNVIDGLEISPFNSSLVSTSYRLHITIEEISENGGISAHATLIETETNKAKTMPISISDGRWNTEDKLFMEGADKLAQVIINKLNYLRGYPAKPFDW